MKGDTACRVPFFWNFTKSNLLRSKNLSQSNIRKTYNTDISFDGIDIERQPLVRWLPRSGPSDWDYLRYLGQCRFAASLIQPFEPIKAIAAVPHNPARLGHIAQLLAKL
jgi:hypothetical protein